MKIIIVWSGEASRKLGLALRHWLREAIPHVHPWMSHKDIAKGKDWFDELMGELDEVAACVVCVTKENLSAPWIYFEAGAVAAGKRGAHVCSFLVDVEPSELERGPLGRFQWTVAEKEDVRSLVRTINRALGDCAHNEKLIDVSFDRQWPWLERRLREILTPEGVCQPR